MKMMPQTPKQINSPIDFPLPQEIVWPPHWRARRSETMDPRKTSVPTASRCFNFSAMGRERFFLFVSGDIATKKRIAMRIAAPIGTLLFFSATDCCHSRTGQTYIQKHHPIRT